MVEKMQTLAILNNKYLRPYGFSGTNFAATVNYTNPETGILIEIMEIKVIGIQINFLFLLVMAVVFSGRFSCKTNMF